MHEIGLYPFQSKISLNEKNIVNNFSTTYLSLMMGFNLPTNSHANLLAFYVDKLEASKLSIFNPKKINIFNKEKKTPFLSRSQMI